MIFAIAKYWRKPASTKRRKSYELKGNGDFAPAIF